MKISIFSSGGHLIQWNGNIALSWISNRHNFSLFRSRSHPVAAEQVSVQSDQRFGKRCRKPTFKVAAVAAILDLLSAHLAIVCLLSALMLIIKFGLTFFFSYK